MQKTLILLFGLTMLLSACGPVKVEVSFKDHSHLLPHKGYWRSQGYGYLLAIERERLSLYDESANHCVLKPLNNEELSSLMSEVIVIDDDTIQLAASQQSSFYRFDKLPNGLPTHCQQQANNPVEVIDQFADIMQAHYAFFDVYGVDWQQRVSAARAHITKSSNDEALGEVMISMIDGLNDGHLYIQAEIDGETFFHTNGRSRYLRPALDAAFQQQNHIKNPRKFRRNWYEKDLQNIMTNVLTESHHAANDRIVWGKHHNIGYINFLGMQGLSKSGQLAGELSVAKKAMNTIIPQLKDTKALVIDISTNSGGMDELGLLYASYFATQPTLAYQKSAKGAEYSQSFYIKAHKRHHYDKPVYVLTSDHTVSAAETFTLAMRALPQVQHVGDTTRGALSDILDKTLLNGWQLGLSNETYLDHQGQLWEGTGIKPDQQVAVFSKGDIVDGHANAIKQVFNVIDANN